MFNVVTILLCAVSVAESFNILNVIDNGIEVKVLADGSFKIGLVTLPANTLCRTLQYTPRFFCHLCSADCTSVHHRYGGDCGYAAGKDGKVCLCGDSPPPGGIVQTAEERCGPLTIVDIPIDWLFTGIFSTVFIARQNLLQCIPDNTGCNVDCAQNHQYHDGCCVTDTPNPGDIDSTERQFCECSY